MEGEQVIEKILSDARAEAAKIKAQMDEKIAAEQAKFDEEMRHYQQQTSELAQKEAADRKNRILAAARMQIAKDHLAEKVKILDEVFSAAYEQLRRLPDGEYRDLMARLMAGAAETGDEEVVIDKDERRIDPALVTQVNSRLAAKGNLKLAADRENVGGGFVLRKDRVKNNVSLKVLLAQARESLEIELAKELFAN